MQTQIQFVVHQNHIFWLKACRSEVYICKGVWDLVELVRSSTDDWKTTLWADINVEQMDIDCKRFAKVCSTNSRGCHYKKHWNSIECPALSWVKLIFFLFRILDHWTKKHALGMYLVALMPWWRTWSHHFGLLESYRTLPSETDIGTNSCKLRR